MEAVLFTHWQASKSFLRHTISPPSHSNLNVPGFKGLAEPGTQTHTKLSKLMADADKQRAQEALPG